MSKKTKLLVSFISRFQMSHCLSSIAVVQTSISEQEAGVSKSRVFNVGSCAVYSALYRDPSVATDELAGAKREVAAAAWSRTYTSSH